MEEEVVEVETGEEVTEDVEVPVHITEAGEDLGHQLTEEDHPLPTMEEGEITEAGAEACLPEEENIPPEDTEDTT